jgi:1,4-alpha-glucan branching enzyme
MIKTTKKLKNTKPGAARTALPRIDAAKKDAVKTAAPKAAASQAATSQFNRVSFELVKADAQKVCVAGSFNQWQPEQTPLVPVGNGRWVGDLTVQPGRYEYLFVVDGQWLPDPNAKDSVQNPFGGKNSVLIASE